MGDQLSFAQTVSFFLVNIDVIRETNTWMLEANSAGYIFKHTNYVLESLVFKTLSGLFGKEHHPQGKSNKNAVSKAFSHNPP